MFSNWFLVIYESFIKKQKLKNFPFFFVTERPTEQIPIIISIERKVNVYERTTSSHHWVSSIYTTFVPLFSRRVI